MTSNEANRNENSSELVPEHTTEQVHDSFEPWMLTAFVLNELSEPDRNLVELEIDRRPELRLELDNIRNSLSVVTDAFLQSSSRGLKEHALTIEQKRAVLDEANAALVEDRIQDKKLISSRSQQSSVQSRFFIYAACATAACVTALLLTVRYQSAFKIWNPRLEPSIAFKGDQTDKPVISNSLPKANRPTLSTPEKAHSSESELKLSPLQQGAPVDRSAPSSAPVASGAVTNEIVSGGAATVESVSGGRVSGHLSPISDVDLSNANVQDIGVIISPIKTSSFQGPSHSVPHLAALPFGSSGDAKLQREFPDELRNNLRSFPPGASKAIPSGDRYDAIIENPFEETEAKPETTFSADVDTASYSVVRQMLQQQGTLPTPDMVRIEELINYFSYDYEQPEGEVPFAAQLDIAQCPWAQGHKLVRIGIQAKQIKSESRPRCNIVFLIDVSGSMADANKLPLVQRSLSMLVNRMEEGDRIAIVVYAGAAGLVLGSTSGDQKDKIRDSVFNLQAGGSTNGGEGIQLAYRIAKENFITGGANRVVLCTDGDFNVGVTNEDALIDLVKEHAKSNVYLTCLGFGQGNYNDALMQRISKDGNGLYGMIDNDREAKKMMVDQLMGTLVTVAKDVKLQVNFNLNLIKSYRLIGYENRVMANADFSNDRKDAGDIGAGHTVTALYEVIPTELGSGGLLQEPSTSKYKKIQTVEAESPKADVAPDHEMLKEWLTLRVRYKQPEADESTLQEFVLKNKGDVDHSHQVTSDKNFAWAASVAEFGLLLRKSKYAPHADWDRIIRTASENTVDSEHRLECVELMRTAKKFATPQSVGREPEYRAEPLR